MNMEMGGPHAEGVFTTLIGVMWVPVAWVGVALAINVLRRMNVPGVSVLSRHIASTSPLVHLSVLALLLTSVIHLFLVLEHLREAPVLGVLFLLSGIAGLLLSVAAYLRMPLWRPCAALLLLSMLVGYALTRFTGLEAVDPLGVTTKAIELVGLASIVQIGRQAKRPRHADIQRGLATQSR